MTASPSDKSFEGELRAIERHASSCHDRLWEMDFAKTSAGKSEREMWERLRKAASDEIWRIHEVVRPLLAAPPEQAKERYE